MLPFAAILDAAYDGKNYAQTLQSLRLRVDQPDLTPSAQVLRGVQQHGGLAAYTLFLSQQHQQTLLAQPLDAASQERFEAAAQQSLLAQRQIEAEPQTSFDDYVAAYYA